MSLEKAMAPHSSTLAWKIPWTEEPGGLQSMGSLRVRHNWTTSLSIFTFHLPALEKEMATHSSILAWIIPGTGEPGGLRSMGSHRVRHDWSDLAAAELTNNVTLVSCVQQHDSAIHIYASICFQIIFPFKLLQCIEQSSLCYTVSACRLSIFNIAVCICWSQTPQLSLPSSFPSGNYKFLLYICECVSVL